MSAYVAVPQVPQVELEVPALGQIRPAGQSNHPVFPVPVLYCPITHGVQLSTLPAENSPAIQGAQTVLVEVS
jgi:hypothetical protein